MFCFLIPQVPPDRFYHTMQRLNEAHGPMSRWTKFFIVALILLFIGKQPSSTFDWRPTTTTTARKRH